MSFSLQFSFGADFDQNKGQVLKHVASGLVLDDGRNVVTLETFRDGRNEQRWLHKHVQRGRVSFVNKHTGYFYCKAL